VTRVREHVHVRTMTSFRNPRVTVSAPLVTHLGLEEGTLYTQQAIRVALKHWLIKRGATFAGGPFYTISVDAETRAILGVSDDTELSLMRFGIILRPHWSTPLVEEEGDCSEDDNTVPTRDVPDSTSAYFETPCTTVSAPLVTHLGLEEGTMYSRREIVVALKRWLDKRGATYGRPPSKITIDAETRAILGVSDDTEIFLLRFSEILRPHCPDWSVSPPVEEHD
jgi:hypothetical protein